MPFEVLLQSGVGQVDVPAVLGYSRVHHDFSYTFRHGLQQVSENQIKPPSEYVAGKIVAEPQIFRILTRPPIKPRQPLKQCELDKSTAEHGRFEVAEANEVHTEIITCTHKRDSVPVSRGDYFAKYGRDEMNMTFTVDVVGFDTVGS